MQDVCMICLINIPSIQPSLHSHTHTPDRPNVVLTTLLHTVNCVHTTTFRRKTKNHHNLLQHHNNM